MPTTYEPQAQENKWYAYWINEGVFRSWPRGQDSPYTIVIPPPNVTGVLHMGHVLNNTLQDILIRWNRMKGRETLWLPGTDHAGIATQNVVERELAMRGKRREDLGREKFVEEVWRWKEKHGSTIIRQLQRLGCSCDWERERFTMDPGLSRAVEEVFVRLYEKGLIYRGRYIVNWCPRCVTAISDEEVFHRDTEGHLWYVHYPRVDGEGKITVATTRPETMLGDVAVAVHPDDPKNSALLGSHVRLPLTERVIPVIADELVDPEFGTGAVKVTPAHDPNDFEIGERHGLTPILAIDEEGRMTEAAGPAFRGMDRFECRHKVVEELERQGLLERIETHQHAVGRCQRCDTIVEPFLSTQWFARMAPLAEPAIRVVEEGMVRFHPRRWTGVYLHWMRNIRDWCISRQLWWGHRIPVYYCRACGEMTVSRGAPEKCGQCGGVEMDRDPDVLDTWFSSWLWPFSTLGWPEETEELSFYYPTNALVTAPDIIFFWVARMIMAGLEFTGQIPFRDVYLHGVVRDGQGRRMSKSLGNSPDPLDEMDQVGADALRLTMIYQAAEGEGVRYSTESLQLGRNFGNKLWNAGRFTIMNLPPEQEPELPPRSVWEMPDRWIISRLGEVAREAEDLLERFRLGEACRSLYQFAWHDFCDWYVELVKLRLKDGQDETRAREAQGVLAFALRGVLRLLHPFVPFVTEAIWHELPRADGPLARASWPVADPIERDESAGREMALFRDTVVTIRNLRAELGIAPGEKAIAALRASNVEARRTLETNRAGLMSLARLSDVRFLVGDESQPRPAVSGLAQGTEVFLVLEDLVDVAQTKTRLTREHERLEGLIAASEKKLANENFRQRAPEDVVKREEEKKENFSRSREKVERLLRDLAS